MSNIRVPSILIDLGHVGVNGLPLSPDPLLHQDLEECKKWGFPLKFEDNRVSLVFDQEQLVPYWIEKEVSSIAWDS